MPEPGFLMNAQKDIPGGIPTLNVNGLLQLTQLPPIPPELIGAEERGSVALHESKINPHPGYATVSHTHTANSIGAVALTEKGTPNGVATLTNLGVIPLTQIPALNYPVQSVNGKTGAISLVSGDVGAIAASEKGATNGVATLEVSKVPVSQLTNITPVSVLIEKVPQGSSNATGQWANMPAAVTELYNNAFNRQAVELNNFTQFRLIANVLTAGTATANLGVQSSIDGVIWMGFDPANTTVNIGATGLRVSSWANIPSTLRQPLILRIVGAGGNGSADPQFNRIELQFK